MYNPYEIEELAKIREYELRREVQRDTRLKEDKNQWKFKDYLKHIFM
jgi:hypothetical protein